MKVLDETSTSKGTEGFRVTDLSDSTISYNNTCDTMSDEDPLI